MYISAPCCEFEGCGLKKVDRLAKQSSVMAEGLVRPMLETEKNSFSLPPAQEHGKEQAQGRIFT